MSAVAARGRRLGYARAASLLLMSTVIAGSVAYAAVSDLFVSQRFVTRPGPGAAAPGEADGSGMIVFAGSTEDRRGALYTVDPNEGTVTELFVHPDSHQLEHPSWSGSATRIAFNAFLPDDELSKASLNSEIFIVDADGGDLQRVTNDKEPLAAPAWAPDGSIIAYARADDAASWELWMVRPDGYAPHPISTRPLASDYAWGPGGHYLAFSQFMYAEDGRDLLSQAVFVMNVNNGSIERLTHGEGRASQPVWSPDGSQIAYLCDDGTGLDICMMKRDGSASYELYETIPGEDPIDPYAGLAWSPDGSRLLFATVGEDSSQLMTVDPMGRYDRPLGPPQRTILGLDWK